MTTRRGAFAAGIAAVSAMLPGVVPFGMIAGLTAVAADLSPAQAMAMSMSIFAGAAQLAMLQLISDGAVPAVILLTVLTINLRFVMYSASLAPHFQHLGTRWRLPLAYLLVDQNYALSIHRFRYGDDDSNRFGHWYFVGAGITLWITWQTATAIGVFMGAGVPREWSLDFAIPLVFLVLLVPAIQDRPHLAAALTGGIVATLAAPLPFNLGIVTGAACGIAAGVIFGHWAGNGNDQEADGAPP